MANHERDSIDKFWGAGNMSKQTDMSRLQDFNQLLLNAVGDGIYGFDCQGMATFSNPAAERLTGWSEADLRGQNSHELMHHSHADGSHYHKDDCPIYAAARTGETTKVNDEVFWRKDGSSFPVEYVSTPLIEKNEYGDDEIVGAVVVFRDISERVIARQELDRAHHEVICLQKKLQAENRYLQQEIKSVHNFSEIIGNHKCLIKALVEVEQVSPTDATVLIKGESGTGKELIAHAIHDRSPRKDRPMIKVNCAAIPDNLVESELFGHEKGAFTGAVKTRQGRFELANGGTLFLDEVAELPLETQTKLLRVLQEKEFERVGGSEVIKVDVRIIAASHRDLQQLVDEGKFRVDLYYRLNVFPLFLPPLRDRSEDIPLLVNKFVTRANERFARTLEGVSEASMQRLIRYAWPGNIRELQNVIDRTVILSQGKLLEVPPGLLPEHSEYNNNQQQDSADVSDKKDDLRPLQDVEREHIERVVRACHGKISGDNGAAMLLAMHPNTLRSRMVKLGIKTRL